MSQPRSLVLFGHYGRQNSGDDAMLFCLLKLLKNSLPATLFRLPTNAEVCVPEECGEQLRLIPRNYGSIFLAVLKSDVLLVGGGSMFHDAGGRARYLVMTARFVVLAALARGLRKEVYLLGIGFGPFTTRPGRLLGHILARCATHITVRDAGSLRLLQGMRVKPGRFNLTTDFALCLGRCGTQPAESQVILGLSILPYHFMYSSTPEKDESLACILGRQLSEWLEEQPHGKVLLITFFGRHSGDADTTILKRIASAADAGDRVEMVPYSPDPRDTLRAVSRCGAVVAMRYHAAVYAYLLGVPFLLVDYHAKSRHFAMDVGLPATACLTVPDLMRGIMMNKIRSILRDPGPFLPQRTAEEMKPLLSKALPPAWRPPA